MTLRHTAGFLVSFTLLGAPVLTAEEPAAPQPEIPAGMREALEKLQLPHIKINLDEWSVDVESTVTLLDGLLETVACIKDTKEHESLVAVKAKPSHIHTALLLLGAEPGNPAIRKIVGEGPDSRFIDLPPRGGLVDVYLVIDTPEGKKEYPISQFIEKSQELFDADGTPRNPPEETELLPSHSFMFTGSVLVEQEEGQPRQYIADYSGNVITLVTFGDETLSLPGIHDDANSSLMWQVRSKLLPELDSPVTLRLKPQRPQQAAPNVPPAPEKPAAE
jgi:hypothetical protein